MAIYLPPVHERTYIASQLDAHAKRWYGKGAAAGSSGKFSNGPEAWDKAKLSIKTPLSHGRAVEAHEYFLGGFNDGERGRELRGGRRNPAGPWHSIAAIRAANKAAGHHWFDRDTMKFFASKVHPTVYGGKYFIASKRYDDDSEAVWTVHIAESDGKVGYAKGPFSSLSQAIQKARGLAAVEKHNPAGAGDWIKAKAVRVVRDASGRARQLLIQT